MFIIKRRSDGEKICWANEADTKIKKILGLAFKKKLHKNEGLLFKINKAYPPHSVHSLFMRFPIDVVFLDEKRVVVDSQRLSPWDWISTLKNAKYFLELSFGMSLEKDISVGDQLGWMV